MGELGIETKKPLSRVQLPDEIIVCILSRLPVKTILKCKSVCKLWKSLISHPSFKLSTTGREQAIVLCSQRGRSHSPDDDMRFFYSFDDNGSILNLPNPVGHFPSGYGYANFEFLGTCNGLILFYASRYMYLWNPLTRSCRKLNQLSDLVKVFLSRDFYGIATGLCYDKSSDDYKVILIKTAPSDFDPLMEDKSVIVASLKKRKIWTNISFPYKLPFCSRFLSTASTSGILVRGHLHWIASEEEGNARWIVYFDEEINQFGKLPMPKDDRGSSYYFGLTVLDGCLCLCRQVAGTVSATLDLNSVLVMKDYGVQQSWTKLFTIRGSFVPLHTRISEGFVLVSKSSHLYICSLRRRRSRKMITVRPSQRQLTGSYNLRDLAVEETKLQSCAYTNAGPLLFVESLESITWAYS